jgi:uncharacterized repeat protein (TIGR03803 family)
MRFLKAVSFVFMLCFAVESKAQTFTTLVNFDGNDGSHPASPLVQGVDGNLYGTANAGGTSTSNCSGIGGCGTFFSVTTDGALTTLYNFCPSFSSCLYGRSPGGTIALAPNGIFYGTTAFGGADEWGEVFTVSPASGTFGRLHSFCSQTSCPDGMNPGGLIRATDGYLYGTAAGGGAHGQGTAFKMSPHGSLTTLYDFCALANCADGQEPSSLIQATNGTFYGLTFAGGASTSRGTIFKLSPNGTVTTLHQFCAQGNLDCPDGAYPAGLFQATDGNLYGTSSGAANNDGTVFRISPNGTFTTLYTFCTQSNCTDGFGPSSLIQASDGNLYGTAGGGGAYNEGTIFQLTLSGVFTRLYDFCSQGCANGPGAGGLVQHTDGNFYGGTFYTGSGTGCGSSGCGTLFKLSTGLAPFVKIVVPQGKTGSSVVILGTNLTGASSVTFNNTSALFTVVSATEITASVPVGATSGEIQVITPTITLRSNVPFHVLP